MDESTDPGKVRSIGDRPRRLCILCWHGLYHPDILMRTMLRQLGAMR